MILHVLECTAGTQATARLCWGKAQALRKALKSLGCIAAGCCYFHDEQSVFLLSWFAQANANICPSKADDLTCLGVHRRHPGNCKTMGDKAQALRKAIKV